MRGQSVIDVAGIWSLCIVGSISVGAVLLLAQSPAETYAAEATVTTSEGAKASAPLTIVIDRWSTDDDRDTLIEAVRTGGSAAARHLLLARGAVGSIHLAGRQTAVKYAYARPTLGGRLITLVTSDPIRFVGGGVADAPPQAGYGLGVLILDVDVLGAGQGEMAPAATVRIDTQNAVVTDDYGAEVVRLSKIARK
jgi:hypothetical protein